MLVSLREYQKAYYLNNKTRIKEKNHAWYLENKAKEQERSRKWKQLNPEKRRQIDTNWYAKNRALLALRRRGYKYGLSVSELLDLKKNQNNKCLACSQELQANFHVDHCHKTGKVRGLLCFTCNTCLGLAKDNIVVLENLANYLRRY